MTYEYVCPYHDCDFLRRDTDDTVLERVVAKHEETTHRRKFSRERFEDRLDIL